MIITTFTENEVLSLKDHLIRALLTYHFYTLSPGGLEGVQIHVVNILIFLVKKFG